MFCQNILLVDDEEILLRVLEGLLKSEPYKIYKALNAREALKIIETVPIAIAIADQRMPGITGSDFLDQVRRVSPETVRVILSGFEDLNMTMDVLYQGRIYMYLKKPWEEESMKESIRRCSLQYIYNQIQILREELFKEWTPDLDASGGFLLTESHTLNPHFYFYLDMLKLVAVPGALIDGEGKIIYVNGAAESLFTVCSDLEPLHEARDIIMPSLKESLQSFLDSNQLNERIETPESIVSIDRIADQTGSGLGACIRSSPRLNALEY